jgi:hypothetical protein
MSNTLSTVVIGGALGGTTMSILSGAGTFALEKKVPTMKTVARDFILGAVLFLLILQILPESTGKLVSFVTSFVSIPAAAAISSGTVMVDALAVAVETDDVEVKVGVPRF